MKRLFILLSLIGVFYSCSKSENHEEEYNEFKQFYDCMSDTKGLTIEYISDSFEYEKDDFEEDYGPHHICIGKKNDIFWFGMFKSTSYDQSELIYQRIGAFDFPQEIAVDMGWGESAIVYSTNTPSINGAIFENGIMILLIDMFYKNEKVNFGHRLTKLLIIENKSEKIYDINQFGYVQNKRWYNNSFLLSLNNNYYCYNLEGRMIAELWMDAHTFSQVYFDDLISYTAKVTIEGGHIRKTSFDNASTTEWNKRFPIPAFARIDNLNIRKEELYWYIQIDYTEYSGEKNSQEIKVNLDTGEITKL